MSPKTATKVWQAFRLLVINGIVLCLLMVVLEALFLGFYRHPVGNALTRAARDYYLYCDRKTVTYEEDQAHYDPEVDYAFVPGDFTFENREYSTPFHVNSLGLRDDESSLHAPDVIVLGDSHAAGWGVDQGESFAEQLERSTGLKVLNTAIPSYATPREIRMLKRADRSGLKVVVIQYCENDFDENRAFSVNGNAPQIMTSEGYQENRNAYLSINRQYFPFKYTRIFFPIWFRELTIHASDSPIPMHLLGTREPEQEARAFLNVLVNGDLDLGGIPVVVLEVVSYNANSSDFVHSLEKLVESPLYRDDPRLPAITTVDVAPLLKDSDYYLYDDHMRASGHRKIAEALAPVVERLARESVATPPPSSE